MINNKYINIFKNKPLKSSSAPKVIVFDLDETLGSFSHLEILWNTLLLYNQNNIHFNDYRCEGALINNILDIINPETNLFIGNLQ